MGIEAIMRLVIYNPSERSLPWLDLHPHARFAKIVTGSNQAEAMLRYIIENYDQPLDMVTMFLHENSPEAMVKEIGYDFVTACGIISHSWEKSLFKWFWPVGVIGVCDREGYPHRTGLPLRQMFQLAEIELPAVIPFIFDQTFAIKHETMTSIRKDVYEALLASQSRFGASWEPCIVRLWLSLYRASNTNSSL